MIDRIMRIDDFKKIIDTKKLDREDLRICIATKPAGENFTIVTVVLTIPKKEQVVMEHIISKSTFISAFLHDPDFKDNKDYKDMVANAYKKAKETFGENITEGNWFEKEE